MDSEYKNISDILNEENTLPINWDASGKMSFSKTASSEDYLINLQDPTDHFDGTLSPMNLSRFGNKENEKTMNRSAFRSMPDLTSQPRDKPPSRRPGPAAIGGQITSTTSLLGGRVTPTSICTNSSWGTRRHTLKEYEQELDKLQKENFNLKLRIWHLEEEFRRRGTVSDDMAKRDLECQISDLSSKLEEKERMLKESLQVLNQLKSSCHRQLSDFKQEHEAEIDAMRRQFAERMRAMEQLLHTTSQEKETLEGECQRLSELVSTGTSKPPLSGESDSDVSLLSNREREVFDLKCRIALLERQLQSKPELSQLEGDLSKMTLQSHKGDVGASGFEGPTLRYEDIESEALKTELKEKDELLAKYRSELGDRDDFVAQLQASLREKDEEMSRLKREAAIRDEYVRTLESIVQDKNQIIADLDTKLEAQRNRLEDVPRNKITAVNNSDDEKLRQLEEELNVQRANALKSTKIIQGLLKQIHKTQKIDHSLRDAQCGTSVFLTPPSDHGDGNFGNALETSVGDPDSSSFVAWLNETTKLGRERAELQNRQLDDLLRRRLAEFQTTNEMIVDRLKSVCESLQEFCVRLRPGNSSKILSAISNELSMLRQDLQESFLVDHSPVAASTKRVVDTASSPVAQQQDEATRITAMYEAKIAQMSQDYERNTIDLRDQKDRLVRYCKKLKSRYRQLSKYPMAEVEAYLDKFLAQEKARLENIDGVVCQLEINNLELAEDIRQHGRYDKKLKEAAKKVKS